MKKERNKFLFWIPRIIVIIYSIFISLFALDVFNEGRPFWETTLALFLHLIPTGVVLLSLMISWKWELIGALLYPAMGVFYIIWAWGKFPVPTYFILSGPVIIIGLLFFLSWNHGQRLK